MSKLLQENLLRQFHKQYGLTSCGFMEGPDVSLEEVELCLAYFEKCYKHQVGQRVGKWKSKLMPVYSYGGKHVIEGTCGRYISNGAFIAAALMAGFDVKRIGDKNNNPNAYIEFRKRNIFERPDPLKTVSLDGN